MTNHGREWIRAAGVTVRTPRILRGGAGSTPSAALQRLRIRPIPHAVAKAVLVRHHYLHSLPGGTQLALGVFVGEMLCGTLTFGVGPFNAYRLVQGAQPRDCLVLSRL